MADKQKRPADDENVEALEYLSDVADSPRPPAAGKADSKKKAAPPKPQSPAARPTTGCVQAASGEGAAAAADPAVAPPPPPGPQPSGSAPVTVTAEGEPPYRCLHCGYPIADSPELRCSECGRTYEHETLEYWFSGEEQRRFEHVLWLVIAALFMKLLLLPQLLGLGRVGGGLAVMAAGYLASRGKTQSTGGYFAIATTIVGAVMALGFACTTAPLPYYTLDIIAACLLLLGMLHDPVGGVVGGTSGGRRITPIILFAAPVFAIACYGLERLVATPGSLILPPPGSGPSLWEIYSPFGFVVPYLTAIGVWVFRLASAGWHPPHAL